MDSNDLLQASATQLATWIRQGDVTSERIVDTHIQVAEAINPTLNAIVYKCYDTAREQAKTADLNRATSEPDTLPIFHGVPFTIKEAFATEGMPHSSGLWSRRNLKAQGDCPTVFRLKKSGAIPLGMTNISELCMWYESSNSVYGRCRNAYDHRRIAGGSSGGEGSIVGSGASPFGLGADVGGSIRMPAFFNGVFGHKASSCVVPSTGLYPISENSALRMLSTGPICRRAEDLWPLMQILSGPDGIEPGVGGLQGSPLPEGFLKNRRVISVEGNGLLSVSRELITAQQRVAEHLADLGAKVESREFPLMKKSVDIWSACLDAAHGTSFRTLMGGGGTIYPWWELFKWFFGASKHTLPAISLALVEPLPKLLPSLNQRALEAMDQLKLQLDEALGEDGILLFPSHPRVAPHHGVPLLLPLNFSYTALFNALEYPATQVPLGLNAQSLPLGVQVIAAHGQDALCIQVAEVLEKHFGGWTLPEQTSSALSTP